MKRRLPYLVLLALAGGLALAQDKAKVSTQESEKARTAIQQYVEKDQRLKGGFFLRDAKASRIRDLKFEKVHAEVERKDNHYVACVDFTDRDSARLDVDFYLTPESGGELTVSDVKVHKINGVPQ